MLEGRMIDLPKPPASTADVAMAEEIRHHIMREKSPVAEYHYEPSVKLPLASVEKGTNTSERTPLELQLIVLKNRIINLTDTHI